MAIDSGIPTLEAPHKLRRNLKLWQVIGLSIGLMAPSMAISINPQGAVGVVGRAIPLTFVVALVGALLVAYGFARLSQYFNHSGSVLGLVGATLGPRAGVFAAWAIAGTYTTYALLVSMVVGIYLQILLNTWGWVTSTATWIPYFIALVALVITFIVVSTPAKKVTDIILGAEGVTIALIIVAAIVVLIKLAGHTAPHHLGLSGSVFSPAKGVTFGNLALGVVFAVLSFAGFEAAAALGDEAEHPRRDIPRAIFGTCIVIGVFYVGVSAIEVLGFGTDAAGLKQFAASPALLGTLGSIYVSPWFGDLILIGTIISACGCCLACTLGASRIVFSLARDGIGPHSSIARVSPRFGTPVTAVGVVIGVCIVLLGVYGWILHTSPLQVFADNGEIGTLILLFAYAGASVGAFIFLQGFFGRGERKVPAWEAIIPVLGVALIIYILYKNVVPWPTGAAKYLPVVAAVWLVIGLVGCIAFSTVARKIGEQLTAEEGLVSAGSAELEA
jgi:amino acid transporter